jgi:two-component system cell cycle sensor histidine kinase/response regulator CckA
VSDSTPRSGAIVVIDDDASMLEVIRLILDRRGHRVLTARTAERALALCVASPDVSLLVADVGAAGPGLSERVAALGREVTVVYVSGLPRGAARRRGLIESGAWFVGKPFTADELHATVTAALGEA